MHAMQYEITLPADYDMGIIRERGEDSPVNQYAPFYLWSAPEGMNSFLWGPGFQGIVRDFGRPEVQHWAGLAYEEGPSSAALPRTATRRRAPVPASAAPADAVDAALEENSRLAKAPGAVATALAVDPRRWELVHFTLWDHPAPKEPGERFEVLHLSQPGRGDLRQGRQW